MANDLSYRQAHQGSKKVRKSRDIHGISMRYPWEPEITMDQSWSCQKYKIHSKHMGYHGIETTRHSFVILASWTGRLKIRDETLFRMFRQAHAYRMYRTLVENPPNRNSKLSFGKFPKIEDIEVPQVTMDFNRKIG